MVKSGIKIFARIRPTKKPAGLYEVGEAEDGAPIVSIHVPRSEASGYVNNKKETYAFRFSQVFDQSAKQDVVFERVAQGVIDNCLEGYNGTIFAYGQVLVRHSPSLEVLRDTLTGHHSKDTLLSLSRIPKGTIYSTHISYLEIYNDSGYDLLDPKHEAAKLEDLPSMHAVCSEHAYCMAKQMEICRDVSHCIDLTISPDSPGLHIFCMKTWKVQLLEDSDGNIHLKNLALHPAANEEEALNWLFLGDTNRMIAETPMNMASTRSHCIFTIHISSREPGSDTIKKAKLHLVDLAGRVSKTGVGGTLLAEAKYINLSLHSLEMVIVALSEKSRTHIPYRNSMMTSVLRDSLGGNCMTTMIATCSMEKRNMDETISTCRFAQRVALVKNEAILNEELDPKLMVARLKQQVEELKDELAMATGEERTDELTDEERAKCKELVQAYLQDSSPEARLTVGSDMRKIQFCFQLLKTEITKRSEIESSSSSATSKEGDDQQQDDSRQHTQHVASKEGGVNSDSELQRLRDLLQQRDDEINVLLKMLKQERRRTAEAELALKEAGVNPSKGRPLSPILGRTSPIQVEGPVPDSMTAIVSSFVKGSLRGATTASAESSSRLGSTADSHRSGVAASQPNSVVESRSSQDWKAVKAELSQARQEAFDSFRKNYADTSNINDHKKMLKIKYAEAKALGERVNSSRVNINKLKSQIEQQRISQGIQGLTGGTLPNGPDVMEEELKKELEIEKANFKTLYDQLRKLKTEIEHIQHLLEKAKVKLQKDFEQWWSQQSANPKDSSSARNAWHTPPIPASGPLASPTHHQPHPPTPLSSPSSSSSHRSTSSRSRQGSSRRSHHRHAMAAQLPQNDQHSLIKKSSSDTLSRTSFLLDGSSEDSKLGSDDKGRGLLSGQDVSMTSGVGSSVSSSFCVTQSGRVALESSSSSVRGDSLYTSDRLRRQPDSLPSVGMKANSDALAHSQSCGHTVTTGNNLHHPKLLFDSGQSPSSSRSFESISSNSSIPLTGNSRADADIIAFYRARQKLIQKDQELR